MFMFSKVAVDDCRENSTLSDDCVRHRSLSGRAIIRLDKYFRYHIYIYIYIFTRETALSETKYSNISRENNNKTFRNTLLDIVP